MARDAVYVLVALALCACIVVAADLVRRQTPPKPPPRISMLELKEFAELPGEFRSALKKMMPDPVMIRQQWKKMTTDQRRGLIQQMTGGMLPQPKGCQHAQPPKEEEVPPKEEEAPPPLPPPPMKKGFLLKNDKKKNPKNKENDEVVALRAVKSAVTVIEEGAEESDGLASNDGDTTFPGSDD